MVPENNSNLYVSLRRVPESVVVSYSVSALLRLIPVSSRACPVLLERQVISRPVPSCPFPFFWSWGKSLREVKKNRALNKLRVLGQSSHPGTGVLSWATKDTHFLGSKLRSFAVQAVDPVFFLFKIVVKSLLSHFKPSQSSSVVAVCLVYTYPPFAFQPVCVFESKVGLIDSIWLNLKSSLTVSAIWLGCLVHSHLMCLLTWLNLLHQPYCLPYVPCLFYSCFFYCLLLC